MNTKIHRR